MASQQEEEAVPLVVAPGGGVEPDEEVKKVEDSRGGEFSVNGALLNYSFNSRISADVDVAESQVAVAGSVDSAAEVTAVGAEEPSVRVDHHAGPASSGGVVDATEKVESWDLSEAVQEGTASKEDSKPSFSEDGTVEVIRSSDVVADAPTSAASVEDSGAADVEEKTGEGRSDEDVGGGREFGLPAEVAVTEDGNPKVQDEGSAEKGDSEPSEAPVEEVHKVGEATTSAEPEKEGASVEVLPSPSADVEEKAVDVEEKAVAVEEKAVDVEEKAVAVEEKAVAVEEKAVAVEDQPVDVADKSVDVEDKPVDVADKSVEVKFDDAGLVSEELPTEDAASEEVTPRILDQGSTGKVEAPESSVEKINENAKATTAVEPDEAVARLEAVPSVSADVEDKSVDVEDKPVDVEDKPIDVADKSIDVGVPIVEMNSEDAGVVSEELPAVVAASEEVSPMGEGSAEKGNIEAPEVPVEEVQDVAEATPRAESGELGSLEPLPSSPADAEQNSVDLSSADAGAVSEDVSPIIRDEESTEKVDGEATEAPVEDEVHEVAKATSGAEPDEAGSNVEAVPSPSVDVEENSVELDSAGAGAVSEDVSPEIKDEESTGKVGGEAPEVSVTEVQEDAEPTTSAESAEEVASQEAVPSPSVEVEDRSVELDSADAGAVSEDVSPKIEDEKVDSEAPDALKEDEVHEVAETTTTAEPDEAVANLEAVPSASVEVEDRSVELDSADAGAVSEDVSPEIDAEESTEKFDSNAPEPLVEEVHEVTSDTKPDEAGSNVEAVPSPSVDVEEKSFELDSADAGAVDEDVSPKIEDEESAEKVDSEAPEPLVEEVHDVAEATAGAEPAEEVTSSIAVPSPSVDVADKSFELDSAGAGAVTEDVSPKIEDEESTEKVNIESPEVPEEDEVREVAGATTNAEPHEAVANVEAVPTPSVDVEEKSVELDSAGAGAVSEDISPKIEDEESANEGDIEAREAPVGEQVHEVAEARTSTEPDVENVEAVPSPFVDVEEKSFDLDSVDAGAMSEDVSPEIEAEGSTEKDREAPEVSGEDMVHELAEATSRAKPDEVVASVEAVSVPSVDVEDKSFELNSENAVAVSEDVSPIIKDEESTEKVDSEAPEPHEVAEAINGAESAEGVSSSFSVPSPSVDVEEKSSELDHVYPTISAEAHEETASRESVSAPAEDIGDKSVQEADSKDTSEAIEVLPPESTADKEDISPEPLAEGSFKSETLFFPDEEVHEVVEETISAEPGEVLVESESALAPSDVEDRSVVNSGDAIEVTTTSEGVDKEGVSPETSSEATISARADGSLESEGSASLESLSSPANNVEDRSLEVNPEDTSEAKLESDTENTNKEGLNPELPAEGSADNVGSKSLFTSVEEVHEVIEETISPELDEGSTGLEFGPASDDVEEKPEDLSQATTTTQSLESVDKELVSRDLPVDELHAPVEEIGKSEDAATDKESTVLESAVASSQDVQSMPETKSREFNFNDLKESLTTSEKEETAIGEEDSSSDAVARDTTPLDVSSPPPAGEKKESRNSYDLHEEAVHLEEAAEKTLQDVKSGDKHTSVAESVAQIVLDESSKTGDSSELISGVIQHVAQLAQDDFQSDPNVLPDTVNQVFDRESEGSPANEGSQPKESSSLGTKFSLFVIWCISLCASHVSSKDMPAPALKLGAEEVAAVLHSNSQGAASSKAASSV